MGLPSWIFGLTDYGDMLKAAAAHAERKQHPNGSVVIKFPIEFTNPHIPSKPPVVVADEISDAELSRRILEELEGLEGVPSYDLGDPNDFELPSID